MKKRRMGRDIDGACGSCEKVTWTQKREIGKDADIGCNDRYWTKEKD